MKKIAYYAGLAWLILAAIFIVICLGYIWYEQGFSKLLEILNPFNAIGYLAIGITLLPGILLHQYGAKNLRL